MATQKKRKLKKKVPIKIQFRIPVDIHNMLVEAAEIEHSSLNGLVVRFLAESARKSIIKHKQLPIFAEGS